LDERLEAAQLVLWERMVEISGSSSLAKERQQVTDALSTLDMIRRIELKISA